MAIAPWMIRSGDRSLGGKSQMNTLGVDDLGQMFLLVENGEGQFSGSIEDGDSRLSIFADGDLRLAQRITAGLSLDLIDDLVELQG